MVKVVSFPPLPEPVVRSLISSVYDGELEVVVINEYNEERILRELENADIVIGDYSFKIPINRRMLEVMKNVKLIQQPSTGYDNIDIEAAKELGIRVANVGGINASSVAEHTVMFALALLRRLPYAHKKTTNGVWVQEELFNLGVYDLEGRTWGILGMGNQGMELLKRLQGWGVRVIYNDLKRVEEAEKSGAEFRDFESLLRESDILSIHLPLTDKTRGMIGEEELRKMKGSALLINVARGEIIDERALVKALKEGWIAGAALDVFSTEPLPENSELLKLTDKNLILTPHIAGATNEARLRIINEAIRNIGRALRGEKVLHVVSGVSP
jgi:glyoxylate reductase